MSGVDITILENKNDVPKGKPKCGKPWKDQAKKRFSSITIGNIIASKRTLKVRTEEKQKRKAVKDLENELKQDKINEKIAKRERREDNLKRRAQNELKSSKYQIKDGNKLKKMSKKQLRNIKKTRINAQGVLEFVSPYLK